MCQQVSWLELKLCFSLPIEITVAFSIDGYDTGWMAMYCTTMIEYSTVVFRQAIQDALFSGISMTVAADHGDMDNRYGGLSAIKNTSFLQ